MYFFFVIFVTFKIISATIDVKKSIYDLAINRYDTQVALVENQGMFNSVQESVVRVYDVGRRRDDEDEQVRKATIFADDFRKSSELVFIQYSNRNFIDYLIGRLNILRI